MVIYFTHLHISYFSFKHIHKHRCFTFNFLKVRCNPYHFKCIHHRGKTNAHQGVDGFWGSGQLTHRPASPHRGFRFLPKHSSKSCLESPTSSGLLYSHTGRISTADNVKPNALIPTERRRWVSSLYHAGW